MTQFTFKAYGCEYSNEAAQALDIMEQANKALIWYNPDAKAGMWFESGKNEMKWVEGNYFD